MQQNCYSNKSIIPRTIARFLRAFFRLLYHSFAWSYDAVAWMVSLGRWNDWVNSVIPFIQGSRVLEVGHGPGHLQVDLARKGLPAFGLDESRQMGRQAFLRLNKIMQPKLTRGRAENLPFPAESFEAVVSTFPTEYIVQPATLNEISRVLEPGGELVILLAAWFSGRGWLERAAAFLFKLTGQVPSAKNQYQYLLQPFLVAGYIPRLEWINQHSSRLLLIIAEKPIRR
ncbi:MAG: methyltransferase domain-containing protein [Anaerolineaceae bacterium]